MLRGIDHNRIIVGAYVDPHSGGICPMLAAHRNGGRTSVASFARAWDAYTGAKRPRRATRREVRVLRSLLEGSLASDGLVETTGLDVENASIAELAAQIRAEREEMARCATSEERHDPIEEPAPRELGVGQPADDEMRIRRRRRNPYLDLLTIAEQALAEEGVWERVSDSERSRLSPSSTVD
jgi:hypothetical protein